MTPAQRAELLIRLDERTKKLIDDVEYLKSSVSKISPKGWDTIKYIATLIAASTIGGGGVAAIIQNQ